MKLNLACGNDQMPREEGWVNVDVSPVCKPDQVVDLFQFPYPWEDSSVDEIKCRHFVEHIPHWRPDWKKDGFILFMEELYRIMKPDATARITFPPHNSDSAFGDPTHTRFITVVTFDYFNASWRTKQLFSHYHINTDFSTTIESYDWLKLHPDAALPDADEIVTHWNYLANVVALMRCHKPQRVE